MLLAGDVDGDEKDVAYILIVSFAGLMHCYSNVALSPTCLFSGEYAVAEEGRDIEKPGDYCHPEQDESVSKEAGMSERSWRFSFA